MPDVRVVKERFGWFDGDVILEEDFEEDVHLFEQVRERPGSTDNVIYVGPGQGTQFLQNVIYLLLDVGHQVDILYDRNLEHLLATIGDKSKREAMVWIKRPLIEERSSIQNNKVGTSLDIGNDL